MVIKLLHLLQNPYQSKFVKYRFTLGKNTI